VNALTNPKCLTYRRDNTNTESRLPRRGLYEGSAARLGAAASAAVSRTDLAMLAPRRGGFQTVYLLPVGAIPEELFRTTSSLGINSGGIT
jgi:hypothetical protein